MKTFLKVWLGIGLLSIGIGVALLVIAFTSGARWEDTVEFISMSESYSGVEKIHMDISCGKVNIIKGNGFSITAENILDNELKSNVKDGIWYIKEDNSDYADIFGIRLPRKAVFLSWNDHFAPDITVTIPEDFVAEDFTLKVGAGDVNAEEINAVTGDFNVDLGRLKINNLNVKEHSSYNIGTGSMILEDIKVKNASFDCGVGNLEAQGEITGDSSVKCGVGNIHLKLDGNVDEYSYDIDRGISNVEIIDGKSYKNISKKHISNSDSSNYINFNCGIGNISVVFD